MSLKDQVRNARSKKPEELDLSEEWGCKVYVRRMSGLERAAFERWFKEEQNKLEPLADATIHIRVALLTLSDEDGNRLFGDADEPVLASKDYDTIARIADVATRINGLSPEAREEIRKNWRAASNSGIGSPAT